ncbi:MAG: cation diffusion facilitator family transporter [Solirubrobacteraceae bacterium]
MAADGLSDGLGLQAGRPVKMRAAGLSIGSNVTLIALKVVAGAVTGSVAILTEAMHSAIDLVASIVAWFSVRKADIPADEEHRYGHYKLENLAAAIEGILILVGSGVIAFEAIRKLVESAPVERLGFGIAVMAVSGVANLAVSTYLYRQARLTESPALAGDAAHLRTDALTSFGVLVGLALVDITGADWLDPAVALAVAAAIVFSGVRILTRSSRVLVDEALPPAELEAIRTAVRSFGSHGVVGYHQLRTRSAGSRRYVDLHVQFRAGTTLEEAHATAHELQAAIEARLRNADVLIHLEPEDRIKPGTEIVGERVSEG